MVSPKINLVKKCIFNLKNSKIDLNKYDETFQDLAFDMITADTFIMGLAQRLIDSDTNFNKKEISILNTPFVDDKIWIACKKDISLVNDDELFEYAKTIENLRKACLAFLQDDKRLISRSNNEQI